MSATIPRAVEATPTTDVATMAIMILTLPKPPPKPPAPAILIMSGQNEQERVLHGIEQWRLRQRGEEHLLIGGQTDDERMNLELIPSWLSRAPYCLHDLQGVDCQVAAVHTGEQATWGALRAVEYGIGSFFMHSSPFHLVRCFGTLLKALQKQKLPPIPIWPVPTPVSPEHIIPKTGLPAWEMIPGEVDRIVQYQQSGDVVTLEELRSYLEWFWKMYG